MADIETNSEAEIIDAREISGAEIAEGGPFEVYVHDQFVSAHTDHDAALKALTLLQGSTP